MDSNPSQPVQSIPKSETTPTLSVSEGMRRMGDLLISGKLSTSDAVIFEHNNFTFTAHILSDGSLRSISQSYSAEPTNKTPLPSKLYSSPSEFASDMAARAIQLDDKAAKSRGKIKINGWNNCTVNGRSLATIRNEMLHEKKHENTNVSVTRQSMHDPSSAAIQPTKFESDFGKSPTSTHDSKEHSTAQEKPPAQGFPNQYNDRIDGQNSPTVKLRSEPLTSRDTKGEENASKSKLSGEGDESSKPEMETSGETKDDSKLQLDRSKEVNQDTQKDHVKPQGSTERGSKGKQDTLIKSGSKDESAAERIPSKSKDELVAERIPTKENNESASSKEAPKSEGKLHEAQEPIPKSPESQTDKEPIQQGGANKVESERMVTKKLLSQPDIKPSEEEVGVPREGRDMLTERHERKDSKTSKEAEEAATPSSRSIAQHETSGLQDVEKTNDEPEGGTKKGDAKSSTDSASKREEGQKGEKGLTREMSSDGDVMEDVRYAARQIVETKKKVQSDEKGAQHTSSPAGSLKEVSDLQQEILGDSDSDEESSGEHERKSDGVLKKRSRSLTTHAQRKKMRTDEVGSPDIAVENDMQRLDRKDTNDESESGLREKTTRRSEIEGMELDPETIEVAAIAAQIEKEEASNRARKNTRLAAGKIKQVDYKAAAIVQAPRSTSPGQHSEDAERNVNDNESPTETTRTTRRRVTPNQWYPSQRSSRRVAKLRGSHERDQSSNDDEIEQQALRSSSEGIATESRSGKESTDGDETGIRGHGTRSAGTKRDGSDRRRGRLEPSAKRTRQAYYEEGDHDSQGRAYSTRASTRENSVVDAAEITALGDSADFLSEEEDIEDDEDVETRTNGHGFTATELESIAAGVRACGSVDYADVREALKEEVTWTTDEARNLKLEELLQESKESIQNLSKSLSSTSSEVTPDQLLSFLSAEVWRLREGGVNTGLPRNSKRVFKKVAREDQVRSTLERNRKKEHRDVEEMRGSLEKEMESRRRAELDTLYIEIQVSEASRALSRERARCDRVDQETEKYKDMETDVRKRLQKAKVLVGHLRGERDEAGDANGNVKREPNEGEMMSIEPRSNGGFARSPVRAARNNATSDDDVEMTDKNITTTSQRLLEMDRLRVLIASREAEAEDFQRKCEKERMRFANALESKNRLETEIYLYKSHSAATHGTGNASGLPVTNRVGKEGVKKVDQRGQSSHGNRVAGNAKQKSGTVRSVGAVPAVSNSKNHASTGRSKVGPGKSGEASKAVKRKPVARNGGHGSDKGHPRG